ncbi:hypothetical protein ZYGR_0AV01240 [Zygosaccharomyces rouxii]|uniref:DNA replication regulator SLD2 n=1 Tax=Zygosaccharomyces rouxii TaxID=4956 RepID=A0A1Q3AJ01_ZYGRO|nr:hypothetical protein ZYGR_0AV01240 [Zygosaccharomyces rouxii]
MSLDQLKIELKTWEYEFHNKNKRPPTKDDIKRLPDIKKMYKQYQALKRQNTEVPQAPKVVVTPSKNDTSPRKSATIKKNDFSNVELGPTPQIYGKAISIFEMKLSPVKKALNFEEINETPSDQPVDTVQDDTKRQLTFPSNTPNSSPFKKPRPIELKYYGPNSPLKLDEENINLSIKNTSPLKRTPQKNMSLPNDLTSFSPSPLVKRPLTKSLLELAKEHKEFLREFRESGGQENPFSQETEGSSDEQNMDDGHSGVEGKEKKTKKRKIIRRLDTSEEGKMVPKDISKELRKLKKQQVNEFLGNEAAEETEEDEQDGHTDTERKNENQTPAAKPKPRKRTSKYNLVSNNFRRLKLPRKHSGNRRWSRR